LSLCPRARGKFGNQRNGENGCATTPKSCPSCHYAVSQGGCPVRTDNSGRTVHPCTRHRCCGHPFFPTVRPRRHQD
jgi:hypothetical protein